MLLHSSLKLRTAGHFERDVLSCVAFILYGLRRMPFVALGLSNFSVEGLAKQGYNAHMYYVYVLKSDDFSHYYYGSTTDIKNRLKSHNNGQNKYTAKYKPWHVVWYDAFQDRVVAISFEKYLKIASGKAFLRKRLI